MVLRFKRAGGISSSLLSVVLLSLLSACGTANPQASPHQAVAPEARAQSILVNLAGLNPRLAEPLVKGMSTAALERVVGLVVMTGVEEAQWAEGLLQRRWWLQEDPTLRLLQEDGVRHVLSEVQRLNPEDGPERVERQEEIRQVLGESLKGEEGVEDENRLGGGASPAAPGPTGEEDVGRAELEDAVRWVQFTQAWSSYYRAAGAADSRLRDLPGGSELALDQAVTMSLVRPDFLERLATLVAEGLGS